MSSVLVCLVLSSSIVHVASSEMTVPRSSVVLIGDSVEMKCSVTGSDSTTWKYIAWNTSKDTNIYLGRDIVTSIKSRYKIDKNISGEHNLIIDSVDLAHAGRYQCTSTMQQSLVNDIQITVLGSSPECSANTSSSVEGNIEQGNLWMWCQIIYTGNMIPIFSWTKDNTTGDIAANTTSRLPLITVSTVNRHLRSDDNGTTYKCKITFQLPNIPTGNATDYEYTWSYALYGPRNLSIVEYEDRLECSAGGNPTPTYRWTSVDRKISIEGPVFILNDTVTSEKDLAVQCIAANVFASERRTFSRPNVFISADKKSVWSISTVGLVLTITSLTVFGIVVLGIGLRLTKLSNTFDEVLDKASDKKSSCQPQQSSKRLNSPQPTDEDTELQRADASGNYCALTDRPTAAREPQVYCELRSYDQQRVKPSSANEKAENKDRMYANVGLHETQL